MTKRNEVIELGQVSRAGDVVYWYYTAGAILAFLAPALAFFIPAAGATEANGPPLFLVGFCWAGALSLYIKALVARYVGGR